MAARLPEPCSTMDERGALAPELESEVLGHPGDAVIAIDADERVTYSGPGGGARRSVV